MEETSLRNDLDLLVEAALAAGREALRHFGRDVQVWWKNGGTSPVTAADHAANDILKTALLKARPHYGWLSEESEDNVERLARSRIFIVDPIDGTRAFMSGQETWAVSVAVVEGGEPVAGVLYAPALDEMFTAIRGEHSFKNGQRLGASHTMPGSRFRLSAADDLVSRLRSETRHRIDRIGRIPSLAYRIAMIADNRMDATLVKPHAHDWDLAAADLILRNAGGFLSDIEGGPVRYNRQNPRHGILIGSNGSMHRELLGALGHDGLH